MLTYELTTLLNEILEIYFLWSFILLIELRGYFLSFSLRLPKITKDYHTNTRITKEVKVSIHNFL